MKTKKVFSVEAYLEESGRLLGNYLTHCDLRYYNLYDRCEGLTAEEMKERYGYVPIPEWMVEVEDDGELMTDREWLESIAFSLCDVDGNFEGNAVLLNNALEYGERCAKSFRACVISRCFRIKNCREAPGIDTDGTCLGYGIDEPDDICKSCVACTYFEEVVS